MSGTVLYLLSFGFDSSGFSFRIWEAERGHAQPCPLLRPVKSLGPGCDVVNIPVASGSMVPAVHAVNVGGVKLSFHETRLCP